MSEIDAVKVEVRKTNKLAVTSVYLGILNIIVSTLMFYNMYYPLGFSNRGSSAPMALFCMIMPAVTLVVAIAALIQLTLSHDKTKGGFYAFSGIMLSIISAMIFFLTILAALEIHN